ncbi:MAG: histidine phosphatase family protein [Patescibacteria group bacterium]
MKDSEYQKLIYFVRHGETDENTKHIYQHDHSILSDRGIRQAEFVAQRFARLSVDVILTSALHRTRQTAEIINHVVQKPIEWTESLREIRRPKEVIGRAKDDPDAVRIMALLHRHRREDWHYSTEENFFDRKRRVQKILDDLIVRKQQHLLVVTHNGVLKTVIAFMLFGAKMTFQEYEKFLAFTLVSNTGITVCKLLPNHCWKLLHLNDLAHLEMSSKPEELCDPSASS